MTHTHKKANFFLSIKTLACLLLLACSYTGFAQKEANIWYFGGNAGLDFSSGSPTALSNSALYTGEGCATISDSNGNLLFYTNGVFVYNSNHQLMPNGGNLLGSTSSSQSAIIVKKPGASNIYYIFTSQSFDSNLSWGLNFYEVDMSLNAGLGNVTKKNGLPITQTPNPPITTPVAEKLTAVYHADGEQIWVISHKADNSQDFVAYLVSATGVNTTPVTSSVGMAYDHYFVLAGFLEENNLTGCLKASPDGTKLASAIGYDASMFVTTPLLSKGVELFDFDAATGIVSNGKLISSLKSYGIEFSPNSHVLYSSSTTSLNPNQIYQYDVTLGTQAAIQASQTLIATQASGIGTLQLGNDGKLYAAKLAGGAALHAINNPNTLGTGCNFQALATPLGTGMCFNGLPNFLTSYFAEDILFDGLCAGSPTSMTIIPYTNIQSANWNFGDTASGAANTSTAINPAHTFSQAGTYTVTVDFVSSGGNTLQVTAMVTIVPGPTATTPPNLTACQAQTQAVFNLTAQTAVILGTQAPADYTVTYHTTQADADAGTNALTGDLAAYSSASATIYVRVVKNDNATCYSTTNFNLIVAPQPVVNTVAPLSTCDTGTIDGFTAFNLNEQDAALLAGQTGVTVAYYTSQANAQAGTNAITTPAAFTNTANPQTIYVALSNAGGCHSYTSFSINVIAAPALPTVPNLTACDTAAPDGFTLFDLTQQNAALLTGQTGATVAYYTNQADALAGTNPIATPAAFTNTVTLSQTVYAVVTNATGCTGYTTFTLTVSPAPVAPTVPNLTACDTGATDGFTVFNLTQQDAALLAGQTGVTVAYYTSQANAEAGTDAITTPAAFSNTSNPQTVYAALTNALGCKGFTSFTLNVLAAPAAATVPDLSECDDDANGHVTFNLTQQDAALIAGQTGVTVTYFTTQANADANTAAITAPAAFVNTTASQIIYVRLSNSTCYTTTSFSIEVLAAPVFANDLVLEGCSPFNLTDIETQLDGVLTVSYYATQADALASANAITNPEVYTLNTTGAVLYLRAQNAAGCYTVTSFSLEAGNCMIQRGISPNNDGMNDNFDLAGFNVNKLEIFNRYGKEVYTKSEYNNEWIGQTNSGDQLPTGTYYYAIKFSDGNSKTGWIYINRQE